MIFFAVENNKVVYAYNEHKKLCLQVRGKLHGYTNDFVTVMGDNEIYSIYDENGAKVAEYPKEFVDLSNVTGVIY